ncbi:MAG: insulinase family protein [Proteobacteria bacterium]|nr:insulinase family protein [Pseudomonadota bacterium]
MRFPKAFVAGVVAASAFCGASSGAPAPAAKPKSTPVTAQDDKVFQFALQNGMQVLVIPDHRAPVVTEMLWFRVGSVDDPPGVSGLAHFFEHMMFRGTKTVPGDQFSKIVARNGGEDNAFTTHDYTCFYEQIAKDRLRVAMGLEADRIANLDLSDENVRTERDVVMEERRMRTDNDPQALLVEQMHAALHLSHPYGRPVIGWPDDIRRIGRTEARDFYLHHYAPNNAVLIVAGDVTKEDVRTAAEAEFGKVQARDLTPRWDFSQPARLGETRLVATRGDVKVPLFLRFYRVPSYPEAKPGEAEALETLAQLVGGDASSMLYKSLVVDRKIAISAGASYDGYARDDGEFTVYAVPRPGVRLDQLEQAVDAILKAYMATAPRPDELERAKTQLVASATYQRDSQFELASAYGSALSVGLTIDDVQEWPARIKAVTGDAVKRAAASDLDKREAVSAYLKPLQAPK